ncbi:GATA zinc finger domain-containing protein 8-like [Belonocnema kinseyi]|uniref:GATA zinc finger domain-containing protein 8-like n=1 Tax=Belonocnema kinseyi TaxID=2817044 RepID=UPI00143DA38E|nr:GATA zinc finger domain-containing protein 8-like [Belonocnema kinseyi]
MGASQYHQTSSQPAYNPHYPTNTGHSYTQSGSYPSGTHSYQGAYGNQGHSYTQSASYPSGTHSYQGSYGNQGGYHPSYPSGGSSFSQPGVVYIPTSANSGRGTGDIVKEALIYSTVNAGVNAAANRIFYPSHYSGHNYGSGYGSGAYNSGSPAGGYDHTQITYNNYYNNQPTSVPQGVDNLNSFSAGASTIRSDNLGSGITPDSNFRGLNQPSGNNQPSEINNGNGSPGAIAGNVPVNTNANFNNPGVSNPDINNPTLRNPNNNQLNSPSPSNIPHSNPPQLLISDEELTKLTEDLFSRQEFDANKYIKLNLQKKVNSTDIADESLEPLFEVQAGVNNIPTIEVIQMLYDNYEYDSQIREKVTPEKVKEQNDFLEVILQTNVMSRVTKWLTEKNYISPDSLLMKEMLNRIWFTPIEGSTSAFERTFLAEKYGEASIMGLQNWVYVNHAESKKEVNYMGYMDKLDLGDKGALLKVVFKSDKIIQPTAIFVGTLPELEMALYTVCFYARPNGLCPISLGGAKFNIFTHTYHSWGKDFLDVAVPVL